MVKAQEYVKNAGKGEDSRDRGRFMVVTVGKKRRRRRKREERRDGCVLK